MAKNVKIEVSELAIIFGILSDVTRLKMIQALGEGERNVTSLCEELGLPQPTVSHHLGILRMNRLVETRRDGKQMIYTLSPTMPKIVVNGEKLS